MTNDKAIEKLKAETGALHALLSEPEPGLFTWTEAMFNRWKRLSDWFINGIPEECVMRKLTIGLSDKADEQLKQIVSEFGIPELEVFRLGVGLVNVVMLEKKRGNRIIAMDASDNPVVEIVLPEVAS